jgi:uncharacterized protein YjbI with pentapeptide repeats
MLIEHRQTGKLILEVSSAQDGRLRGARLAGADFNGRDRRQADLQGADLRGAFLYRAQLDGADLRGADLRRADLSGASLSHADLRGADLRGTYLGPRTQPECRPDLREAKYDGRTRWPAFFNPRRYSCARLDADLTPAATPAGRGDEPTP